MSGTLAKFARDPAPGLLHNMSVPPKTVVRDQGLAGLFRESGFGGSGVGAIQYRNAGVYGASVRFQLPAGFPVDDAATILAALGHPNEAEPDTALVALIEARAQALSLPDGCVVSSRADARAVPDDDVLSTLAVLTKCSARVWLRAKTPNVTVLQGRRAVTLLIPPTHIEPLRQEPTP